MSNQQDRNKTEMKQKQEKDKNGTDNEIKWNTENSENWVLYAPMQLTASQPKHQTNK